MKFGEKVRDLRKKHSLTQDELAQCLGINNGRDVKLYTFEARGHFVHLFQAK